MKTKKATTGTGLASILALVVVAALFGVVNHPSEPQPDPSVSASPSAKPRLRLEVFWGARKRLRYDSAVTDIPIVSWSAMGRSGSEKPPYSGMNPDPDNQLLWRWWGSLDNYDGSPVWLKIEVPSGPTLLVRCAIKAGDKYLDYKEGRGAVECHHPKRR